MIETRTQAGFATGGRRTVLVIAPGDIARLSISRILASVPFDVSATAQPADGLASATEDSPDLVIVELGAVEAMPRYVRALGAAASAPIMLVGEDVDEGLRCLEMGIVVDFVRAPIWERELRARAVCHAGDDVVPGVRVFGDLRIDVRARTARAAGTMVELTSREFDLLAFLTSRPGATFTREELLEHVWGSSPDWQCVETVTEHVYRIRRKLEPDPSRPRWLLTVPGSGYCFSSGHPAGKYAGIDA